MPEPTAKRHGTEPDAVAPDAGMPDLGTPDLAAALAGTRFGPVEWHAEIDSTNRVLLDAARAGCAAGRVVVADAQTAGRGRLDRTWTAPPGGSLLVSVLLRPSIPREHWHLLTTTAGLAAAEAVDRATRGAVRPRLKWPNDLVLPAGKLAGLLAETTGDALVLGMGLNVDWPAVPDELVGIATAISLAGAPVEPLARAAIPTRHELLVAWLRRWHGWLEIVAAPGGIERVRAAAERASATLGAEVRVELAAETFTGRAIAITAAGHLAVETASGVREVAAGDVVHVRGAIGAERG